MQSAAFNIKYATDLGLVTASTLATSPDQLNDIRSLLTADDGIDFGSAAWFLTTQCQDPNVRSALQTGSQAGWETYLTSCVGTTVTSDRLAYWQMAMQALSGSSA